MNKYFIKKLQFQELGSPKDGKVSRGRYLYIPEDNEGFFPSLSQTELNDTTMLPIVPSSLNEKVYCTYVYHNDKFHESTAKNPRNEYRFYLNAKIDPNRSFFEPTDIIVFKKEKTDNDFIYKISLFKENEENYEFLNDIISSTQKNFLTFNNDLPFLDSITFNDDDLEVFFPKEVEEKVKERQEVIKNKTSEIEEVRGASLFNSTSFRDFVLLAYKSKCAITNEAIFYKKLINLEAAHIKPKSHNGSFLPCNGIAMSRDIHWAFDRGMFTINEDYSIAVHNDIKNNLLNEYNNQKISIPEDPFFRPEKEFLQYHKENVFGLFKRAGVLRAI